MSRKRMFRRGRAFRSLAALVRWLEDGGWTYWGYRIRPIHPTVMCNQQLRTLINSERSRRIFKAERNTT